MIETDSGTPVPQGTDAFSPTTQLKDAFDAEAQWNNFLRVADATARNALDSPELRDGILVEQLDNHALYQRVSGSWTPVLSPVIGRSGTILPTVTVGNGSLIAYYQYVGGMVHEWGKFTYGSTSSLSAAAIEINTAVTMNSALYTGHRINLGRGTLEDVLTAAFIVSVDAVSTTRAGFFVEGAGGTYTFQTAVSNTVPIGTWSGTNGDTLSWDFWYLPA